VCTKYASLPPAIDISFILQKLVPGSNLCTFDNWIVGTPNFLVWDHDEFKDLMTVTGAK